MTEITKPVTRAIIKDFAADIRAQRVDTAKPSKPGFPIWLWYRIARTSRRALISGAPT